MLITCGCTAAPNETFEDKLDKRYLKIDNYAAKGNLAVYSNKTKNTYDFIEGYKSPDTYLIEYPKDNMKILFEGDRVTISDNKSSSKQTFIDLKDEYMHLFINHFFENYFSNQGDKYVYEKVGKNYVLKCDITTKSGDNLVEILTLNSKNLYPVCLDVMRKGGEKIMEINFTEFEFVKKFKEDIFNIN